MQVASLEKSRFHLFRHAHMEFGGSNLDVNDIPFLRQNKKIVHHAWPWNDYDNRWLLGKNYYTILRILGMFLILDMDKSTLLNPKVEWWLQHMKWQLVWFYVYVNKFEKYIYPLQKKLFNFVDLGCFTIMRHDFINQHTKYQRDKKNYWSKKFK